MRCGGHRWTPALLLYRRVNVGDSRFLDTCFHFNGDGIPDLGVIGASLNEIGIIIGNGDGTFQSPVAFSTGGYDGGMLAVGDFNGDGSTDVALSGYNSSNLSELGMVSDGPAAKPWRALEGGRRFLVQGNFEGRQNRSDTAVSLRRKRPDRIGAGRGAWAYHRGAVIPTPWEARWSDYERRDGMRIPTGGEVAWMLPERPKPYFRGRITSLRYGFAQ